MSQPDDIVSLDKQLCFSVYNAAHAFTAAYKPLLEPFGLTYPQYLVLLALWEKDGVSVKDLAERLHLDSGTLTPLLKRLQTAGYLSRERDPQDERLLRIELTEKGQNLRGPVSAARKSVVCALGGSEAPIQKLREEIEAIIPLLRGMSGKLADAGSN